jgi:hypothetical protein
MMAFGKGVLRKIFGSKVVEVTGGWTNSAVSTGSFIMFGQCQLKG